VAREQLKHVVTNRVSQLLSIPLKSMATRWLSMNQLNLELLNRSGAHGVGKLNGLNGAQRLNALNVLNNILCWKD